MSTFLFILNEAPYGNERTYNGLRLAGALAKRGQHEVKVFLIGDGASAAHAKQKVPQGHYNIEVMISNVVRHNGEVGVCGSCMDARGITTEELMEGVHRSTLEELANWSEVAGQVLVF
ncbi:MAG: DsrE family protein [Pseudomonadota bacterium]